MVPKEGDQLGIEAIRDRIETDNRVSRKLLALQGAPKIYLRNSIPVSLSKKYVDDYEITPEYVFEWDENTQKVHVKEKPWVVLDDQGVPSYSLLPQAVVVSLIKQMTTILNL